MSERPPLKVVGTRHKRRTTYPEKTKLAAVIAAEITSQTEVEHSTGIPQETIRDWVKDPKYAEIRSKTREQLVEEIRVVAHLAVKRVAETLPSMEPRDALFAFEKAATILQLVSGEATARVETRELLNDFNDHETEVMQEWLRDQLKERLLKEGMGAPDPT